MSPSGAQGPDVSAATPPVRGGAVQIGPADLGLPPSGAPQPVYAPDLHSGWDRSVRLWGAAAEGLTAGDQATQLHEQTWYVLVITQDDRLKFSPASLVLSDTCSFTACAVIGNVAQRAHAGCSECGYTSLIALLAAQHHLHNNQQWIRASKTAKEN